MNIENITLNENLTQKPIPPKILHSKTCKSNFTSYLKMNAEIYKTCDECRNRTTLQNRLSGSTLKHILSN